MKKLVAILVAGLLALSFAGCEKGGSESSNSATASMDAAVTAWDSQESNDEKNELSEDALVGTYKVPSKEIYVDVPKYDEVENGYTRLFSGPDYKYVGVVSEFNYENELTDASEAHKVCVDKFLQNMDCYLINSFTADKEETVTVNGIEMIHFEGKVHCGHDQPYDVYGVGYSFLMDGMPCQIFGSFSDENHNPEDEAELKALVTAMAKTVRNHE